MLSLPNIRVTGQGRDTLNTGKGCIGPNTAVVMGPGAWPLGELQGLDSVCLMGDTQPSRSRLQPPLHPVHQAEETQTGPGLPGPTDWGFSSHGATHPPLRGGTGPTSSCHPVEIVPLVKQAGSRSRVFPHPLRSGPGDPCAGLSLQGCDWTQSCLQGIKSHRPSSLCDRKKREEARRLGGVYRAGSARTPGVPATHPSRGRGSRHPGASLGACSHREVLGLSAQQKDSAGSPGCFPVWGRGQTGQRPQREGSSVTRVTLISRLINNHIPGTFPLKRSRHSAFLKWFIFLFKIKIDQSVLSREPTSCQSGQSPGGAPVLWGTGQGCSSLGGSGILGAEASAIGRPAGQGEGCAPRGGGSSHCKGSEGGANVKSGDNSLLAGPRWVPGSSEHPRECLWLIGSGLGALRGWGSLQR